MCPDERIANGATVDMPRSYLSTEPAEMRAMEVDFDTVLQFRSRMMTLEKNGHKPDKAEIIVLGGTFSTYPRSYQEEFIRDIYYAANTYFEYTEDTPRPRYCVELEQEVNEGAKCHIVGITLETRPDQINKAEIERLRYYGCTRVQLGIQHTNNEILDIINRRHHVEHSIKAIQMLKENGFKVDIHIMPDLPGSNPELDKIMMLDIFQSPYFQPDYLKIYPCLDVQYTEIRKWKADGRWKPYAEENNGRDLIDVVVYAKRLMPRWMRVNRVQRDFPVASEKNNNVGYVSNTIPTNFRQLVLKELANYGETCKCINCREIKDHPSDPTQAKLMIEEYDASEGREFFISYNTEDMKYLYGFIRLRFNNNNKNGPFKETDMALIRELHVYGSVEKVNEKEQTSTVQHMGFGKKLIKEAERIAWDNGYSEMAIISAVGTRNYYRKFGYELKNTYMVKELSNPHILLDIALVLFMLACWFILAISLNKDNIEEYY
jgi:ELP3 family radical SAM enzyme/protein acetyltransferase